MCIVCDFGHTSICIGAHTQIGAPGDPRYIAPEVMGEEHLSPKSDIYMLGVMSFELLTGGWLPFFGRDVSLSTAVYQCALNNVKEAIISDEGMLRRDRERLKRSTSPEAKAAVEDMMKRHESDRPDALKILHGEWLKGVWSEAHNISLENDGWGLWQVHRPDFVDRLARRAKQASSHGLLLSQLALSLDADAIFGCRVLFSRWERTGTGVLTREAFHSVVERAGLVAELADDLFNAVDLDKNDYLDFRSIMILLLDIDSFNDQEMLQELRSVLNYVQGPDGCSANVKVAEKLIPHHNVSEEISAELLLRIIRESDVICCERDSKSHLAVSG